MKLAKIFPLALSLILISPTIGFAKSKGSKRSQPKKLTSERCYSKLSEMPENVRPIFDNFLKTRSKKSFWGPVLSFGSSKQKVRDIKGLCLMSDPNGCGWTTSEGPSQILVGKKTGTFQILRDWNQDPRSRSAQGFPLRVCANPTAIFPVHMRFTIPHWTGNINFVTAINPKGKLDLTSQRKVLSIATFVQKDQGPKALYSQSSMDIQPMIDSYMASMERPQAVAGQQQQPPRQAIVGDGAIR